MTTIDYTASAAPRGFSNPLAALLRWVARRHRQRIEREAFRRVLALDEHMLKDIGVTRGDVIWAANLPIERSAARELQRISRR